MKSYPIRPVSRNFGFDRGLPVDRHYIEKFLCDNQTFVTGDVLEVGDDGYTKKFGQENASSNVLDMKGYPGVTVVADIEAGKNMPVNRFDCFIMTQVLHILYDIKQAAHHAVQVLKPGGTLLITVPGVSQSCKTEEYGDYWRFTSMSFQRLFEETEDVESVTVYSYGNLATAQAFLEGRAAHELKQSVYTYLDPDFEVLLGAVVRKSVIPSGSW